MTDLEAKISDITAQALRDVLDWMFRETYGKDPALDLAAQTRMKRVVIGLAYGATAEKIARTANASVDEINEVTVAVRTRFPMLGDALASIERLTHTPRPMTPSPRE